MSDPDVLALVERIPVGWSEVSYAGRRWGLTRAVHAGGRSMSVYAEELGGTDVVSTNLYLPAGAGPDAGTVEPVLRPCEMAEAKVLAFLTGWDLAR